MTTEREYCQNVINATRRFEAAFEAWLAEQNDETISALTKRFSNWREAVREFEGRFDIF